MSNVTLPETLFERAPKCIAKFKTLRVHIALPTKRNEQPNGVTKSIQCICGNEKLYLDAAQHKETKGVCRASEYITFDPPFYISCSSCKRYTLLFDPLIYGWKSESGEGSDSNSDFKLTRCTQESGRVFVNYSYKNAKEYDVLLTRGVENPEDYFDTFAVFYRSDSIENIREIISVDCG